MAELLLRKEKFELMVLDQSLWDGGGLSLVDRISALAERVLPTIILLVTEPAPKRAWESGRCARKVADLRGAGGDFELSACELPMRRAAGAGDGFPGCLNFICQTFGAVQ